MSGPVRTTRAIATAQRRGPAARTTGAGKTLQPKLDVTPAGDRYEAEADRVAAQVMGSGTAPAMPQISSLVGTPGGQRATKEGTAANAEKKEDLKEKEKSGKQAQKKTKAPEDDRKPKGAQKKAKPPQDDRKPKAVQKKTKDEESGRKTQRAAKPKGRDDDRKLKAAQKKAKGPEEDKKPKAAQKKTKPEEPEKKKAQRDATGAGFTASSATEGAIDSMQRGGGAPLEAGTRSFMENRIGRDFSGVQIHDTPAAHQAADDLGAHAFTVGRDVFFARGAYRPDTGEGRRLIAHELTHTIQQAGGSAQAKRAQRNGPKGAGTGGDPGTGTPTGDSTAPANPKIWPKADDKKIDVTKADDKKIVVPSLEIPNVNGVRKGRSIGGTTTATPAANSTAITDAGGFTRWRPTPLTGDDQRKLWLDGGKTAFKNELPKAIRDFAAASTVTRTKILSNENDPNSDEVLYLRKKKGAAKNVRDVLIGTPDELSQHQNMLTPNWNRAGAERIGKTGYQVDHIHERQLGGAHDFNNLWLLQASANQSAGSTIEKNMKAAVKAVVDEAKKDKFWTPDKGGNEPSIKSITDGWSIEFKAITTGKDIKGEQFTKEDISSGQQLEGMTLLTDAEKGEVGLLQPTPGKQPEKFSIFPYQSGGTRFEARLKGTTATLVNRNESNFLGGYQKGTLSITYDINKGIGNELGVIDGTPRPSSKVKYNPKPIRLMNDRRLGYGVYMNQDDLKAWPRNSSFVGLSPLNFTDFGVGADGLIYGSGMISASPFLFKGLQVPLHLHGDEISIDFPIPVENLNLGPVSIDAASFRLGLDSDGIVLGGSAEISVKQLGSGHLDAKASKKGIRVEGDFNFDFNFLDNATAKFLYDMGEDKLELTLAAGVQKGKIPGVESGNITAKFSKEGIEVTGTMQPVGFLSAATITVSYTKEQGLRMEAKDVPLPLGNLPAVKNAKVTVGATRNPEGVWSIYGGGSADFALPAVTGSMALLVRDDILTFTGTGNVAKGPASGTLSFTATNQAVDEEGKPIEGPALDHFRTWGKGSVTVNFGKIITGTAGIELTETNEIIVKGGIALPPTFDVFPIKKYEKQLLHIEPPEFPIWGVSVAGVGIGIFAFFDAYLNFDAFVGPGQLKDTKLDFSYNFMKPEEASIDGNATFDVPAGAGFTLDIGGGLRARLATAQVSGRVGLDARLGIDANAGANVKVHWDPTDGLALSAKAYAKASPKFEIGANASVTASVDLLLAEPSYTWGPWRKQLGSFGPAMSVGIEFPVSWSEKNGLDLSLDNITVTKPDIDAAKLMKDAFLELV